MRIRLPNSAVIYPVAGETVPEELMCELEFQDGSIHAYRVPVVNVAGFSLSELFQKHLNMFLPFSLLRFRSRLDRLAKKVDPADGNGNNTMGDNVGRRDRLEMEEDIRKELTAFLEEIILGLEKECQQEILTKWQCNEYMRLIDMAANRILYGHRGIWKEVRKMTECKLKFFSDIVEEYEETLSEKDAEISEKDAVISEKDAEIATLKKQLEEARKR